MKLERRHLELIAEVISEATRGFDPAARTLIAERAARGFRHTNPKFDPDRFERAARA